MRWVRQAEEFDTVSDEQLAVVPRKFFQLDKRLSCALQRVATGELGRKIAMVTEAEMKQDRSAKGIVLLRMIFDYFRTNRTVDVVYEITDLDAVRIKGNNVEAFQNTWVSVLTGMNQVPDDRSLEVLYHDRVEKFNGI